MDDFRMSDLDIALMFYGGCLFLMILFATVYAVVNSIITMKFVTRYFRRNRSNYHYPYIVRDPSGFSILSAGGVLLLVGLVTLYFNLPRH